MLKSTNSTLTISYNHFSWRDLLTIIPYTGISLFFSRMTTVVPRTSQIQWQSVLLRGLTFMHNSTRRKAGENFLLSMGLRFSCVRRTINIIYKHIVRKRNTDQRRTLSFLLNWFMTCGKGPHSTMELSRRACAWQLSPGIQSTHALQISQCKSLSNLIMLELIPFLARPSKLLNW